VNAIRWVFDDIWRTGSGRRLATLALKAKAAKHQFLIALKQRGAGSGMADAQALFGLSRILEPFHRQIAIHYQALRGYVPQVYPGRVTLFRARTRPLFRLHGRYLGWDRIAGGGLDVIDIPGNHESILKKPDVGVLAEALIARCTAAENNETSR
jgi:thioesterase domain-containing protein